MTAENQITHTREIGYIGTTSKKGELKMHQQKNKSDGRNKLHYVGSAINRCVI